LRKSSAWSKCVCAGLATGEHHPARHPPHLSRPRLLQGHGRPGPGLPLSHIEGVFCARSGSGILSRLVVSCSGVAIARECLAAISLKLARMCLGFVQDPVGKSSVVFFNLCLFEARWKSRPSWESFVSLRRKLSVKRNFHFAITFYVTSIVLYRWFKVNQSLKVG